MEELSQSTITLNSSAYSSKNSGVVRNYYRLKKVSSSIYFNTVLIVFFNNVNLALRSSYLARPCSIDGFLGFFSKFDRIAIKI